MQIVKKKVLKHKLPVHWAPYLAVSLKASFFSIQLLSAQTHQVLLNRIGSNRSRTQYLFKETQTCRPHDHPLPLLSKERTWDVIDQPHTRVMHPSMFIPVITGSWSF